MPTAEHRKNLIRTLLKGIETGDPASVAAVDESKYIQHNPQTQEGSEGLAQLFARLAKTNPRVNMVRAFSDGDFVFAHMEYDFSSRRIGFEVFRFEGDKAVEHWDNIQPRKGPGPSGHSMVDGPTDATDFERTEDNRQIVRRYIQEVLIDNRLDLLVDYTNGDQLIQHSPTIGNGVGPLRAALSEVTNDIPVIQYEHVHRILADGSFVLSVSEGLLKNRHTAFYDLYRLESGRIVEHWDTIETVAPESEWKNSNGKF